MEYIRHPNLYKIKSIMFSQMKTTNESNKRTLEETVETETNEKPKTSKKMKKTLYMAHEALTVDSTIVVAKTKQDDLLPKLVLTSDPDSKYPLQVNTPFMSLQFGDTKVGGDTGKFGKDETNYKYNLKTVCGLPEKVAQHFPDEEGKQQEFVKYIEDTCNALLTKAFNTKGCMESHKKKATKAAKKNKTEAVDEFLKSATLSALKDYTDQDGDDHNMFCAARRGQYKNEQGESVDNRMVFWKRTRTGFEPYDLAYVPHGSVVKYQVSFRAYSTPNMYGISCDLGKNVIVLLEGKKSERRSNTEPDVPYIEW